jgi:hypothetical protein
MPTLPRHDVHCSRSVCRSWIIHFRACMPERRGRCIMNRLTDRRVQDLLAFIEARAHEDRERTCRSCPNNADLPHVGDMAWHWLEKIRRGGVLTGTRVRHLVWIAGLHRDHDEYRREWEELLRGPVS